MPVFSQRVALAVRNVKAFLNLEAGVVRGTVPESGSGTQGTGVAPGPSGAGQEQRIEQLRRELREKDGENARLRSRLAAGSFGLPGGDVRPENMIWMFGSGRTGSSWLSTMMGDLEGHARWNEPYVGELFGSAYYIRAGERMRGRKDYALGDDYREAWIHSIRNFVLEGANARFSGLGENGYLAIKEPNGSIGAPLLAELSCWSATPGTLSPQPWQPRGKVAGGKGGGLTRAAIRLPTPTLTSLRGNGPTCTR
jgi:hypothetical protein